MTRLETRRWWHEAYNDNVDFSPDQGDVTLHDDKCIVRHCNHKDKIKTAGCQTKNWLYNIHKCQIFSKMHPVNITNKLQMSSVCHLFSVTCDGAALLQLVLQIPYKRTLMIQVIHLLFDTDPSWWPILLSASHIQVCYACQNNCHTLWQHFNYLWRSPATTKNKKAASFSNHFSTVWQVY